MTSIVSDVAHVLPWNMFGVRVAAARRLTPSLARVTFRSDPSGLADLEFFADNGFDQRFKLILPPGGDPENGLDDMPTGADWYARWRVMDPDTRPVVRTYTVRAVRPGTDDSPAELDVDMVLHGIAGPASGWLTKVLDAVENGDSPTRFAAMLLGPDARFDGAHGGVEFVTDVRDDLLLVADETALPAVASILERLPAQATGTALIEVATAADALDLPAPTGVIVRWLPRDGQPNGAAMAAAAVQWSPTGPVAGPAARSEPAEVADPDHWDELAWEVPDGGPAGIRAWVAGEAGAVRTIRRHLVGPCGLPRGKVAFMGYWRLGRAEN